MLDYLSTPDTAACARTDGRRRRRRTAFALVAAGILALGAGLAPAAASTQLSAGLSFSDIDLTKTLPQISPDGQYAVYGQDAVINDAFELWSVPMAGGTPVLLSDVLTTNQHVAFKISPNSARVVYLVDQDTAGRQELYSVPIGGGVSTKLNTTLGTNRNVIAFEISPTNDRVFYVADAGTDNVFHLYSVPITGGTSVRVSVDRGSNWDIDNFKVSPNGATVVYRHITTAFGNGELWSVPAAGPADSAVIINRALTSGGAVQADFEISPDSSRAIYRADASVDETFELYSVPITGGTSTRLNGTMNGDVTDFQLSANGARVVYRADQAVANVFQLYSVPIAGGTATVLNGALGSGEDVESGFAISADSSRVVYRSDEDVNDVIDVYSVPITGGTPTKLNPLLTGGSDVLELAVSGDSTRVAYLADQAVDGRNELYSVPIGGGTAVKLNRALASGGNVQNFLISPDSNWVVYGADQDSDTIDELLAAPIAGGTVLDLNGPLVFGGKVVLSFVQNRAWQISSSSQDVLYVADEDFNDEFELYTASLGGTPSAPLNVAATAGDTAATVTFSTPTSTGGNPITGYTVTSNPAGGTDDDAGSLALSHHMSGLLNGTPYTFTVQAMNAAGPGAVSLPSNSVTPATVPSAPSAVVAIPRNFSADVDFAAAASNGGSTITGYTVISNPAGGTDSAQGTLGLQHLVTGLTNGIAYTFTVVAQNAVGPSTPSAPSSPVTPGCTPGVGANLFCDGMESNDTSQWSATLSPAGPPTSVVAVAGNAEATVTFVAPLDNGGSTITGYTVTPSPATPGWVDSNAGSTALSHVVTGLSNGTAYTFTVRATNAAGPGTVSLPSNSVTPATVPGAPTSVVAVAGNASATVGFVEPVDNGGLKITGYTVTSSPPDGTDSDAGTSALSHAITGLTNGVEYTFTVTATNGVGTGDPSAPSNPVTPTNPS